MSRDTQIVGPNGYISIDNVEIGQKVFAVKNDGELVIDEVLNIIKKPYTIEEICAAAEDLINNPKAAAAIGRQGRETAKSFFDCRQQGKALLAFLEEL